MKSVFLGGSRNISRLTADVQKRLDKMIDNNLRILIGDANGADKAMQRHFDIKGYRNVEVFCAGGACRNNVGAWNVRTIASESRERDFEFYAAKDQAMTREASVGFMLWDGKSIGTLLNVLRLLRSGKKVVVYVGPARQFFELKQAEDWSRFIAGYDASVRKKVEQKAASESSESRKAAQTALAL